MRWAGLVARMEEVRGVYRVLVGRPERKRPLERPLRRWEDSIKMGLMDTEIDGRNWIQLPQYKGPVASFCEHSNEPPSSTNKIGYCLIK
jgi:hypothetical protein